MAAEDLKQYLRRWRREGRDGALPSTAAAAGGTSSIAAELPRSFRPHRIVPLVYLGALKDVADVWALHQRLLPEELLLIVSTCSRSPTPTLEMRELLLPARPPRATGAAPRVRRLAVCSWEKLNELFPCLSGGPRPRTGAEGGLRAAAAWLRHSLESRSFLGDGDATDAPSADAAPSRGSGAGLVYLKLCLPWRDEPAFPARAHFEVATALMRAVVEGLRRAVVCHCVAGASRSVTLVCAYLLCCCGGVAAGPMLACASEEVVRTVLDFVREVRLCACPNEGFMRQLTEYTGSLLSAKVMHA
ncbi:phosphoric monoester hydrolase [Trypanosoma conorhini]|uniref:Phosphoric monoester hydrolase n=1 Tax=Trypanosoma conorhini TaxID=83891 RepID=A0A422Q1U5_9TRYP|nr:phosphoric monoester hydrolase [Trypanosoma conorhini]RNF23944.1 phosphoric monoester hydrolase [Trypanosoma conorhini]